MVEAMPAVNGNEGMRYNYGDGAVTALDRGGEDLEDKYEMLELLGGGTFGTVYKARDRRMDELVAVKRLHLDEGELANGVPAGVIREASLLCGFDHPNIARLRSIHTNGPNDIYLIFDYVDTDLHKVLKGLRNSNSQMPIEQMKRYSQNLFDGVHACHTRLIMHRDLKPQNILVSASGLKICDFGLARLHSMGGKSNYTKEVVTLWYRAPEILLGAQKYGPEVDLWSAGCVVGEMATNTPVFPGDSEIGTIFRIMQLLGTPMKETWPGFEDLIFWKRSFPKWPPTGLDPIRQMRPELGEQGLDLLRGLLNLNPAARLRSRRALAHAFLQPDAEADAITPAIHALHV